MNEPAPREIIKMAIPASQKETCGYRIGFLTFVANLVDEASGVRSIRVLFDFEQPRIILRQRSASDASQPTRERSDRNTDAGFGRKWIRIFVQLKGRHPETFDLIAEHAPNSIKQTIFVNRKAADLVPSIKPHCD